MSRPTARSSATSLLAVMCVSMSLLTGFAPFDLSGLSQFEIIWGRGDPDVADLNKGSGVSSVETEALFHTLSSRYGGGGVLMYMEFLPRSTDFSGMLLIDLRHAGLPDLDSSTVRMPDARRAELYYQEWDRRGDLFVGQQASGDITIRDLYRGKNLSAISVTWDLLFATEGPDGVQGTEDDAWRRVVGSAVTSVSVEEALRRDSGAFYRQRRTGDGEEVYVYAPDGDIQVNCFGGVYVQDEPYDEESYSYEDDSSCEGDTWEDDSENPQEGSGCAGGDTVDDGEPDPQGGCDDGVGDDIDDPGADTEDDGGSFYGGDYDSGDDGGSGCDDDDSDTGGSSSTESTDSDPSCDSSDSSSSDSSSCDSSDSCESDEALAATDGALPLRLMRARLDRLEATSGPIAHAPPPRPRRRTHPALRQAQRVTRVVWRYAPFLLLVVVIRLWRRRVASA